MRWERVSGAVSAFLLYAGVNVLFILKYGLRVAPVLPTVAACAVYVALMACVTCVAAALVRRAGRGTIYLFAGLSVAALVALQLHFDPYSLQVDRWSAIHNFLANMLRGEYPYAAQTHLGGYGSPFPVWQLFHLPFYLLGNVGFSFVLCLLLYADAARRLCGLHGAAVAFLLLVLSPAFLYEVSVRSDLMSNFLLCAALIMYLHRYGVRFGEHWAAVAVIGGLMMSTRLSAVIPLIVYYGRDFLLADIRRKVCCVLLALLVFALTFLPFALWDGRMLFFFEYNPFVLQTRQGLPVNALLILALCVLTSLLWRGRMQRYFPGTAVCLFALVLLTFLSDMFLCDTWGELFSSRYDISYFNMSLPFAVAALAVRDDVSGC